MRMQLQIINIGAEQLAYYITQKPVKTAINLIAKLQKSANNNNRLTYSYNAVH